MKVLLFDLFKAAIWFFIFLGFTLMYICIFEIVKLHLRYFWRSFFLYTSITQSQIEMCYCLELSTRGNVEKVWKTILVAFLLFPMANKGQDQHGEIKIKSFKEPQPQKGKKYLLFICFPYQSLNHFEKKNTPPQRSF